MEKFLGLLECEDLLQMCRCLTGREGVGVSVLLSFAVFSFTAGLSRSCED